MFRIGGSAEGITSGLAPRQGYANNNAYDQLVKQIPKIQEQAKKLSYRPRGTNVYDFLTEFGLDIASRSPVPGGILATAATSAKEPYQRFMERKGTAAEQQYASESDMFKTLIGAQADILSAEKEGKGWLEQWKFEQIPILNETIARLSEKEEAGTLSKEEVLELKTAKDRRSRIIQLDPIVESHITNNKYLVDDEIDRLWKADKQLPEDEQKYKDKKDVELQLDAIDSLRKRFGLAEGGRVGYQAGNTVMPGAMPTNQGAMPTDQGPAPEDMGAITYEELRARLPQEISDDIVRLLANSAEALEDFAMIQTEQDINNFNRKYGVTLVLPAEG